MGFELSGLFSYNVVEFIGSIIDIGISFRRIGFFVRIRFLGIVTVLYILNVEV
jgi:hypothetical protein